jgi:hypothetical protein
MPKSTRQISPGSVLFILGFHRVEHLESFQRHAVAVCERLGVFFRFNNAADNLPPLFVRQPRNFGNNFRLTYGDNLNLPQRFGKSNSNNFTRPTRRFADTA